MMRWTAAILLLTLSLAGWTARTPVPCDEAAAERMGCVATTLAAATPDQETEAPASCCAAQTPAPEDKACGDDAASDAPEHACPMCAIVCGALCERSMPWGLIGVGVDGAAPSFGPAALLSKSQWLPREASQRFPAESVFTDEWLTFDRPRRQAKLCVWTV